MRVGVIGGGLSAITFCENFLRLNPKAQLEIFEKSRGLSGRISTRSVFLDENKLEFDHGARYFKVRTSQFQQFLSPYIQQGLVQDWKPRLAILDKETIIPKIDKMKFYVGNPKMNSIVKAIYDDTKQKFPNQIKLHLNKHIRKIVINSNLSLKTEQETFNHFDYVVSSVPSHQALDILPLDFLHTEKIRKVKMSACFSVMIAFEGFMEFKKPFDAFFVKNSLIDWICLNHTKPNRNQLFSLVVQTNPDWSEKNIDKSKENIFDLVFQELETLLGKFKCEILHRDVHIWRYAFVKKSLNAIYPDNFYLFDRNTRIICIGDWCADAKVEGAFKSGFEAAKSF